MPFFPCYTNVVFGLYYHEIPNSKVDISKFKMDIFNKLYSKAHPLIQTFLRKNHSKLSIEIQNELHNIFGKIVLLCSDIYKSDILKEKYNLNIDLSNRNQNAISTEKRFIKNFRPCEICGYNRVSQLCHIIPRNEGGNDSDDNLLSLCANHHYLFDNHRLTKEEWNSIKWEEVHEDSKEYALSIRYKKHEMYWKYNYPEITSCECGSQDFELSYSETSPVLREGGIESVPGKLTKHMRCKTCGQEYASSTYKNIEYKWWQEWVIKKEKTG